MALNSSLPSELQPAPGAVRCPRDGAGEPGHPAFGTAMQPGSLRVTTAGNRPLEFGKNINGAGMAAVQTIGNVGDPAPIKPALRLCPSCRVCVRRAVSVSVVPHRHAWLRPLSRSRWHSFVPQACCLSHACLPDPHGLGAAFKLQAGAAGNRWCPACHCHPPSPGVLPKPRQGPLSPPATGLGGPIRAEAPAAACEPSAPRIGATAAPGGGTASSKALRHGGAFCLTLAKPLSPLLLLLSIFPLAFLIKEDYRFPSLSPGFILKRLNDMLTP